MSDPVRRWLQWWRTWRGLYRALDQDGIRPAIARHGWRRVRAAARLTRLAIERSTTPEATP